MKAPVQRSPRQLARRAGAMNPSAIREILKLTERPGIISLAGGLPSPDTFPIAVASRTRAMYSASVGDGLRASILSRSASRSAFL